MSIPTSDALHSHRSHSCSLKSGDTYMRDRGCGRRREEKREECQREDRIP